MVLRSFSHMLGLSPAGNARPQAGKYIRKYIFGFVRAPQICMYYNF